MTMEVVFLGTGCGVPTTERAAPALLLKTDETSILVDAGAGTLRQLVAAGTSYKELDFIFLTHFHPDHSAELVPFLFASKYWPADRNKPLKIIGPEGLVELCGHLKAAWGRWVDPTSNQVEFEELPHGRNSRIECGDITVESGPVHHNPESLGYRFTGGDVTVAVTGDTDEGPKVAVLGRGADLLITEGSFPDDQKREGHLTPRLAARAAAEAGAKAIALVHFYPETNGLDLMPSILEEYDGGVILTEDLLRVRIVPED